MFFAGQRVGVHADFAVPPAGRRFVVNIEAEYEVRRGARMTMGADPDGKPHAEPWVQELMQMWEQSEGIEALVYADSIMQPIDEFLWNLWCIVRRVSVQAMMRLDSNEQADTDVIGEEGRAVMKVALHGLAGTQIVIAEAVGVERMKEFFRLEQMDRGGEGVA